MPVEMTNSSRFSSMWDKQKFQFEYFNTFSLKMKLVGKEYNKTAKMNISLIRPPFIYSFK